MIVVNFIITSIALWIVMFLNYRYLRPALFNSRRFKLFALRDRLAILAMKGELSENAPEYEILMLLINDTIRATGTFSVTFFLQSLVRSLNDQNLQADIRRLHHKINSCSKNYKNIAYEYFDVVHDIFSRETRILRQMFFPLLICFASLLQAIRVCSDIRESILRKKETIDSLDHDILEKKTAFAH